MISMEPNKKIALYLYRSIKRHCIYFDKNPHIKKYYTTPNTLRGILPTFYLPSISFTQHFKEAFDSINNETIKDHTLINPSISRGFNVLKNLNLARFNKTNGKQTNLSSSFSRISNRIKEAKNIKGIDIIIKDKSNVKENNNVNETEKEFNNEREEDDEDQQSEDNGASAEIEIEIEQQKPLDKGNITGYAEFDRYLSSKSSLANLQIQRYLKQQPQNVKVQEISKVQKFSSSLSKLKRESILKKNNNNTTEKDKKKPEVSFSDFSPISFQKHEDIQPGVLLVSHPSNEIYKSVVLITHCIDNRHFGLVLNQVIPTLPTIAFLQEHIKHSSSLMNKANNKFSKNMQRTLKESISRPLAHFGSSNWFYGGPNSLLDNKLFTGGITGLEAAHVIHNNPNIKDCKLIREGLYLGGNIKDISSKLTTKQIGDHELLFFIGCCSWKPNQLSKEIQEGRWFIANTSNQNILQPFKGTDYWMNALKSMGGDYSDLVK